MSGGCGFLLAAHKLTIRGRVCPGALILSLQVNVHYVLYYTYCHHVSSRVVHVHETE